MMIRVSIGTAAILGLEAMTQLVYPTTAYLMLGEGCTNDCGFCAQSRSSSAEGRMLSRVTWPRAELNEVLASAASAAAEHKIERVCLQTVSCCSSDEHLLQLASDIMDSTRIPLSVSLSVRALPAARKLLELGADRVALPIDAVTEKLYREVKGGDFVRDREAIAELAADTGRVVTHVIIGLGETEKEAVEFLQWASSARITPGLFAFTPVRGTKMAHLPQPDIGYYRRMQLVRHLVVEKSVVPRLGFADGAITSIDMSVADLTEALSDGQAFTTSGCMGCNRPFYNERPTGPWYNYSRPLTAEEFSRALAAALSGIELAKGDLNYGLEAT